MKNESIRLYRVSLDSSSEPKIEHRSSWTSFFISNSVMSPNPLIISIRNRKHTRKSMYTSPSFTI